MGVLNLAVSFALAFSMALRSHGSSPACGDKLQRLVLRRGQAPLQAILPPKA